ncbi:hypothetical protein TW95_gp0216 [Pandoravirus inopinatum]|uniref:Uncharacterized protein n=1 Tax=Pandoravirus inopinatum TaxID=1605721 RepID=A0A0B5J5K8_9VIRU|nr:hypothetical protein TW95_gp0216 [Pandoravirus inopinatum]AJF96950.1 hypothetical protein [Pandoravirus inopinatum]
MTGSFFSFALALFASLFLCCAVAATIFFLTARRTPVEKKDLGGSQLPTSASAIEKKGSTTQCAQTAQSSGSGNKDAHDLRKVIPKNRPQGGPFFSFPASVISSRDKSTHTHNC